MIQTNDFKWQPIDTAPKNKSWLLGSNNVLSHAFLITWSNYHKCFLDYCGNKIDVNYWMFLPEII